MYLVETHSVQELLAELSGVESSSRQIERIPACVRDSLIPSTLEAISLSKMNNLESAAAIQCINGFDVKLKLIRAGTAPIHNNPNQTKKNSGLFVKSIAT